MAQTFTRVNKTRKESEVADLRRDIISKQTKNLNKHRNAVYSLVDSYDDDWDDDDPNYFDEHDEAE